LAGVHVTGSDLVIDALEMAIFARSDDLAGWFIIRSMAFTLRH